MIEASPFTATGPSSRPVEFRLGSARMWGVGFLPLGWGRFFCGLDAASVADRIFDGRTHPEFDKFAGLIESLCNEDASIEEQYEALSQMMLRLARPCREEEAILRVNRALAQDKLKNASEFAEAVGMSLRSLERLCRRYFGFSPKLLLRRQRFMRSLAAFMLYGAENWSSMIDSHYYDQSHFSHDFVKFMHMTPTEYAQLDHPILSTFMEQRAKTWGSPVQTMDAPRRPSSTLPSD